MTDEWTRVEKRKAQSEQAKAIMDFVSMLSDKINELEKENAELEKNYKDSLVACGVLKNKVELLAQPSPLESMQDTLITTQKVAYEKQKEQLTNAKEIIKKYMLYCKGELTHYKDIEEQAEQFLKEIEK